MGQRHQVYLIARITPHAQPLSQTRYRCVAALHHQWCYGCLPLNGATRFITLIKQKENAEIIREEIRSIHGLYGTFGGRPELPDAPCPFTHFLMHSAYTSDLSNREQFYESNAIMLPASMGTMQGDNNDGITIIDVTNPESPAYCFVSIHGLEGHGGDALPTMTPLSATQYLRAYYPLGPHSPTSLSGDSETGETDEQRAMLLEQTVVATLHPFESVPMITINTLAEAWPTEYTTDEPNLSGVSLGPKESSTASANTLPSLVDLTLIPSLKYALQTGEIDCLDRFMWLPGNVSKIKEALRAHNALSNSHFALLSKVISVEAKQTKSIDLSHFPLTGEQVIELLSSSQEDIEVLDLSHVQQVTTDILRQLIPTLPNLRRLVLLHTIPDVDVLALHSESPELFYRLESFIHLAFLRPLGQAAFPAVFSHIIAGHAQASIASLPYFTPDQLIQGLTDYLSPLADAENLGIFMAYEPPLLAAYASTVRGPQRSWSERIVPFVPGNSSKTLNVREGWFFAWLVPNLFTEEPYRYAFAKINKELMNECDQRINKLRPLDSRHDKLQQGSEGQATRELDIKREDNFGLSDEEMRAKEIAIKSEYADRRFHVFDIKSFFQELIKEGRPAPSPGALSNLFAKFEGVDDGPHVMTQAELKSFLDKVERQVRIYALFRS